MLRLIQSCAEYLPSYIEACDEYAAHAVHTYAFTDPRITDTLAKFDRYREERDLPAGRVGSHFYWLVDDETQRFIGEISIRHRLTPALERYGGHIGYGVRFSEWGKGYGTRMLRLALDEATVLGLDRVLITCDDDNIASARVMEKNGFTLADKIPNTIGGKAIITRRYWKTL